MFPKVKNVITGVQADDHIAKHTKKELANATTATNDDKKKTLFG